jgi:antigen flippase
MSASVPDDNSPAAPAPVGPASAAAATAGKSSYGQILKSSALIGGSSVLNIGIGIVRTKVMAMLLGPAGFGLMSLYGSILDLALSIAAMGINSSGVRQIAEAASSGDSQRIARTAVVLRRTAFVLGLVGAVALAAFSPQISTVTFGSDRHAGAVALLALGLFFRVVADSQGALIQGMRRIADLARMGVLAALLGTVVSIALVYALGEEGVAPSLVGGAAIALVMAWWFSRKVLIERPDLTRAEVTREAGALLKLGVAFMGSGFLTMGAAYVVRMIVLRDLGLEAAGFYQAAWTLGGFYVGIVLQAMGADFYPRLVGVASNDAQCNRVVNEQAHVSLLLAGPGVIATLTFAPLVLWLFYSPKFAEAVEVLRWVCLGVTMRVITWPMGYIIVAKNRQLLFLSVDLTWTVVNVVLTWMCVRAFGLPGAGVAFFGSYVIHAVMVYPIVRGLTGFRWSIENGRTVLLFVLSIGFVFCGFYVMPSLPATGIGALAMVVSGIYSLRVLAALVPVDRLPHCIQRLLVLFRFARAGS